MALPAQTPGTPKGLPSPALAALQSLFGEKYDPKGNEHRVGGHPLVGGIEIAPSRSVAR